MDNIEIEEYINNLSLNAPQYLQDYAITQLVHLDKTKLQLLLKPISKNNWKNAAIVLKEIGYSGVKPLIPELLEWIKDINCPGAQEIANLLTAADEDIIPYVKKVLISEDGIWIVWLLSEVVSKWNRELTQNIKEDLLELAVTLDNNLIVEGVDIQAIKILYECNLVDKDKALLIIKRKRELYQELLENLQVFKNSIE